MFRKYTRMVWSCHGYFGWSNLSWCAAEVYQNGMISCKYFGHIQLFLSCSLFGCRSKYYRQTVIFSSFVAPEMNSLLNRQCYNILLQFTCLFVCLFIYLFIYLFVFQLKSVIKHLRHNHNWGPGSVDMCGRESMTWDLSDDKVQSQVGRIWKRILPWAKFKLRTNYPCKTNTLSDMAINVPEMDKSSRYKSDKFSV